MRVGIGSACRTANNATYFTVGFGFKPECVPPPTDTPPDETLPTRNTAPTVIAKTPRAESRIKNTMPRITAIARDKETNLVKKNVKLYAGRKRVFRFSYSPTIDKLTATSRRLKAGKLKAGKRHTVKIVATDAGSRSTAKSWRFVVLKRR